MAGVDAVVGEDVAAGEGGADVAAGEDGADVVAGEDGEVVAAGEDTAAGAVEAGAAGVLAGACGDSVPG